MSIRSVKHASRWSTWWNRGARRERIGGRLLAGGIGLGWIGAVAALVAALAGDGVGTAAATLAVFVGLSVASVGARVAWRRWL